MWLNKLFGRGACPILRGACPIAHTILPPWSRCLSYSPFWSRCLSYSPFLFSIDGNRGSTGNGLPPTEGTFHVTS